MLTTCYIVSVILVESMKLIQCLFSTTHQNNNNDNNDSRTNNNNYDNDYFIYIYTYWGDHLCCPSQSGSWTLFALAFYYTRFMGLCRNLLLFKNRLLMTLASYFSWDPLTNVLPVLSNKSALFECISLIHQRTHF